MGFLSSDEISSLRIMQFIFHVVQHEDSEPILLDETPIGKFEGFFLDRVKETLKGNHYEFVQGSSTLQLLQEISKNPDLFVSKSKQLAINFHAARNKRIKPGAIILMRLIAGSKELFSLIKYDHEQVVGYQLVGGSHAILQDIINNFTRSRDALQKSALIELSDQGGEIVVVDRTVQYDITDYFRGFLNVKRVYSESDMTSVVHEVIIKTALECKDELPKEITSMIRSISFQAIQNLEYFDQEMFFNKIFGSNSTPKMVRTYETLLKRKNIEGDSFKFDKNIIKPPKERKYRTREGVKFSFGEEAERNVNIEYGIENKPTIITIKTQKLIEE